MRVPNATPAAVPVPAGAPALPATPAVSNTTQALILLLLTQQMTARTPLQAQPIAQPLPLTPIPTNHPIPSSPAGAFPRVVSLSEFCQHYNLSSTDENKLADLGFIPGDRNITKLEKSDWEEVGFKRLAWLGILDVHTHFLNRSGAFS